MRVKLEQLEKIVNKTIERERTADSLKTEITRALGTSVYVGGTINEAAECANDRLDVLERTGRINSVSFKPSVMLKLIESTDPEVRRLVARTVPQRYLDRLKNDKNLSVRYAVAKRVSLASLSEMLKRSPYDDELRLISKTRRLNEAGLPDAKKVDEPFDMYGEKLGDLVKQWEGPELSDLWYKEQAEKFLADYGGNIEYQWEEPLAKNYCRAFKQTSGVDIDEAKMLKAITDLIEEKEDAVLEKNGIKETLRWLRSSDDEIMNESFMPVIKERNDVVADLLESEQIGTTFIEKVNELFNVKQSTLPRAIRKYARGEVSMTTVPCVAHVPGNRVFTENVEIALDRYCESWNRKQAISGEPIRISWSTHPDEMGKVSFTVELK